MRQIERARPLPCRGRAGALGPKAISLPQRPTRQSAKLALSSDFEMPGAGLEPARPLGGHLILSRPCGSRPVSARLRNPRYSAASPGGGSGTVSVGLGCSRCPAVAPLVTVARERRRPSPPASLDLRQSNQPFTRTRALLSGEKSDAARDRNPRAARFSCSRCIVSCSDAATLLAGGRLTATATRSAATSDATANGGDAAAVVAHRASAARRAHARIGGESPGRMQTSLLLSLIEMDELAVPLQKQRTFMWPPCEVVDCPAPSRRSVIPATTRRGRGCLRGLLRAA